MRVLAIAMLCHAANAAYCASIGDNSQVPWDQAPEWQKDSAVKGVEFCLANPDAPASANHESWMKEKVDAGWVYGETKDPDAKPPTHPCIVPFDELPAEQQFKDVLFKTIVAGCVEANAEMTALTELLDASEEDGASTDDQIRVLTEERDAAIARAEKAEGGEKRAKASLTKATTPAKPRKIGALGEDKALAGDDLRKAIDDADEVQIAFSDGTREVHGIAPINVAGDAWGDHQFGLVLKEDATIEGPREGSSVTIDGYALILDGKHVAYARRSTPLQVAPGQRVSLKDDIIF